MRGALLENGFNGAQSLYLHQIFAYWDGIALDSAGDVLHCKVSAFSSSDIISKNGKPNKATVQQPAVSVPCSTLEQQHQQTVEALV